MTYSARLRDRGKLVRSVLKRIPEESRTELKKAGELLDREADVDALIGALNLEAGCDAIWAWLARWIPELSDNPVLCLPLWQWASQAAAMLAKDENVSDRRLAALIAVARWEGLERREREAMRARGKSLRGGPVKRVPPQKMLLAIGDRVRLTRKLQQVQSENEGETAYRADVVELVSAELPNHLADAARRLVSEIGRLAVKPSVAAAKIAGLKHDIAPRRVQQGRTEKVPRGRRPLNRLVYVGADTELLERALEAHRRGRPRG